MDSLRKIQAKPPNSWHNSSVAVPPVFQGAVWWQMGMMVEKSIHLLLGMHRPMGEGSDFAFVPVWLWV